MFKLIGKIYRFFINLTILIFLIAIGIAVFNSDDKKSSSQATAEQSKSSTDTVYYCDASSEYGNASHQFTVNKDNKVIAQTIREDNMDPLVSKTPSRNWDYLGDGKFKHRLMDDIYECSTTVIDNTTDIRSQYKYASKASLERYVMNQVKAVSGTNPVKFHTILGAHYKTFPNWGASKKTLQGRTRYSLRLTITNAFGAEVLYTGVVFADGGKVVEYTLHKGHVR